MPTTFDSLEIRLRKALFFSCFPSCLLDEFIYPLGKFISSAAAFVSVGTAVTTIPHLHQNPAYSSFQHRGALGESPSP